MLLYLQCKEKEITRVFVKGIIYFLGTKLIDGRLNTLKF